MLATILATLGTDATLGLMAFAVVATLTYSALRFRPPDDRGGSGGGEGPSPI